MSEYERYLIDSGDNDITSEQERKADLEEAVSALTDIIERAYGILWRDHSGNQKMIAARRELLKVLTKDSQKRGIEYAKAIYGPTTDAEILAMDEPLTDVQRSVRDGAFGVRSAK